MNPLTVLICIILLFHTSFTTVNSIQTSWSYYVIDDSILSFSILTEVHQSLTRSNLAVQCNVTRLCRSPYVEQCSQPNTVKWFTPRSLPPQSNLRKEITFTSKVVSTYKSANYSDEISVLNITSTLELKNIGYIHQGLYECSSFFEQHPFTLDVEENPAKSCAYDDQCFSYNCDSSEHCQCSGPEFNWVPKTKSCVKRVPMGSSCTIDAECQMSNNLTVLPLEFGAHLSPVKCLQNVTSTSRICQCDSKNDVQVTVAAANVDVCLTRASLGSICYSTAQCTATTGEGSFCGLDMKNLSSNSTSSNRLVCQCADGWQPSFSSNSKSATSCSAYTRCDSSVLGFNEHYAQGACPHNQFCRSPGYCLCLPNYQFTGSDGGCSLQRGIDIDKKSFLEEYFWLILVCIVAVVVVVFAMAMFQVISSKMSRNKISRQQAARTQAVRLSLVNRGNGNRNA